MELLEIIMRLMDNYPLISITFCLFIALGLIIYEVSRIFMNHPHNNGDRATINLVRHSPRLVKEQ